MERRVVPAENVAKALVIRKDGGEIQSIRRNITLTLEEGSLVKIPGVGGKDKNGKWVNYLVPSAKGFMEMGGACGVRILHPPTVIIEGQERGNPCSLDGGKTWYSRSVAIGYSETGQLFGTDRTVVYDTSLYAINDMLAKANKSDFAHFFQITALRLDDKGQHTGGPAGWLSYPVDEHVLLWVDPSKPEVRSWLQQINQRRINAVRTCQTFSDRNAMQAHPALPKQRKFSNTSATLSVTTWYSSTGALNWDKSVIDIDVDKLLAAGNVQVDSAPPESISDRVDEVKAEEAQLVGEGESADPDVIEDAETGDETANAAGDEPESAPETPTEEEGEEDPKRTELINQVKKLAHMKPKSVVKKACDHLGVEVNKDVDFDELTTAKLIQLEKLLRV